MVVYVKVTNLEVVRSRRQIILPDYLETKYVDRIGKSGRVLVARLRSAAIPFCHPRRWFSDNSQCLNFRVEKDY